MTGESLISVRTEVVKEVLVGRILERAAQLAAEPSADAAPLLLREAERTGYAARRAELELFEPARQPAGWLAELLHERMATGEAWASATAALSRELASREPLERPHPDDERAVSWRIPGPGGHVRHYVIESGGLAKRDFIYGLLVRCCEEVR